MRLIDLAIAAIEAVTRLVGRVLSWLVLYMVLATFANVILRYAYGITIVPLIESVVYAFAIVMAACAGYALLHDEHVRIDILYAAWPARRQALLNLAGCAFLLGPMLWIVWTTAMPYVQRSWRLREGSSEVAGLPYVYLLKTFILVFVVVLAVQGTAFALRALRTLVTGRKPADAPT